MLTEKDISEFYNEVEKLGLKFPVAAISKATGYGKSNVSQYLSGKLEPSESFIGAFYKAFPKSTQNVARETNEPDGYRSKYLSLLEEENSRIKKRQAESLDVIREVLLMNQAILKTLRNSVAQLIAKQEKTDVLEVAHRLDKETAEYYSLAEKGNRI